MDLTKHDPILPLVLCLLLSACTPPQPSGRIAFSSNGDGNAEIYLINADGTSLLRPTHDPA